MAPKRTLATLTSRIIPLIKILELILIYVGNSIWALVVWTFAAWRGSSSANKKPKLEDVPCFIDFAPGDKGFQCIHILGHRRKEPRPTRCLAKPSYRDRYVANTIRNALRLVPPDSDVAERMLQDYAGYCLCWHHKCDISSTKTKARIASWISELRDLCEKYRSDDEFLRRTANTLEPVYSSQRMTYDTTIPGSFPDPELSHCIDRFSVQNDTIPAERPELCREITPEKYRQIFLHPPNGSVPEYCKKRRTASLSPSNAVHPGSKPGTYVPYTNDFKLTMLEALCQTLDKDETKSGDLYAYTRRSNNSFREESGDALLKIGYSEDYVKRLKIWEKQCSYEAVEQHAIVNICNAKRAEFLIHEELRLQRRRELSCIGGRKKRCKNIQGHDEFFEVEVVQARRVMDGWARWIRDVQPYDEETRQLKDHVVVDLFRRKSSNMSVSVEALLEPSLATASRKPLLAPEWNPMLIWTSRTSERTHQRRKSAPAAPSSRHQTAYSTQLSRAELAPPPSTSHHSRHSVSGHSATSSFQMVQGQHLLEDPFGPARGGHPLKSRKRPSIDRPAAPTFSQQDVRRDFNLPRKQFLKIAGLLRHPRYLVRGSRFAGALRKKAWRPGPTAARQS